MSGVTSTSYIETQQTIFQIPDALGGIRNDENEKRNAASHGEREEVKDPAKILSSPRAAHVTV
jgi:hypothetical protein